MRYRNGTHRAPWEDVTAGPKIDWGELAREGLPECTRFKLSFEE